jgi:serine/threonine protein kinase/pimeloyl-ACP methyl ester carboxylesterase/DNA-binding winged helix-turn-helix (wHTH) protein/class 3 adenylate cyclase
MYEFGSFRLDPTERLLTRGGLPLALTPKAFDTLLALIENSRHVVTKEELMNRVWPDIFVEETNLAQHISMLRKVLGERPGGGQYIETVPKRGYRFVVPVNKIRYEPSEVKTSVQERPLEASEKKGDVRRHVFDTVIPIEEEVGDDRRATIEVGSRIGRYEIISLLGKGGMGAVYLANDTHLDRRVALKLLSEKYTGDKLWLRRFIREAKAASALNHPNIITIHEIGQAGGVHFIATEYIEGKTLRHHLAEGRMKIGVAINVAAQVASALAAAHAAGIIHRDIKPENIMLRPDGYVKALDFGLAKRIGPEGADSGTSLSQFNTDPGMVMGTVNYMSPEQARGLSVDARSDIFSLGVALYEMLTGRAPFTGPSSSDVIVSILDSEPPRLSQMLADIPAELERIVDRALRKDREERYQSVKDFYLDLKNIQQELELQAKLGGSRKREWQEQPQAEAGPPAPAKRAAIDPESLDIPEVHYARSGEVNIAYQVVGDGPFDLVFVMGWISHLEYFWSEPSFARFLRRLAGFSRVILFDKRGTGLSDRVPLDQLPTLEQRMDDVRAVMEAAGCERAVLCGVSEGGPMCSLFAATYPEKTLALVMIGSYARRLKGEGYPWGPTEAERELFFDEIRQHWGGPVGLEERAPSVANDPAFRSWWAAYLRSGASPGAALALTKMNTEIDIRHVLPTIRVPTLVIHRTGDPCLKVEEGRYLAENIPGAKFIELPGVDHLPFVGDQDAIIDSIEEFLTGMRHAEEVDRVLATVLVAKVTGWSTDAPRRDLLDRHQSFVKKEVELFKGRLVEITHASLLATFDGPARAIRAACVISDSAKRLGIKLQAGLHTGECDVMNDVVSGAAVEIASQVAAQSASGEVLVSSTVKDLVAGAGIRFAERGARLLGGDWGEWRLFAIERGAV